MWRTIGWTLVLAAAVIRPGVDRLDRALAAPAWDIPSAWNAVADAAIQTAAVDPLLDGRPAPWRQASVLSVGDSRIAVVTISDLRRSRATFLSDDYRVLGVMERTAAEPALVTDETRGYKPLSHVWPLVWRDRRLETLIAFAPLRSDPPMLGRFAYLALTPGQTELLFVCELVAIPGPIWGELARVDVNDDGELDLVLYPNGKRDVPPVGTFIWDAGTRAFAPRLTDVGRRLVRWWSTGPRHRVEVPHGQIVDDAVRTMPLGGDPARTSE